MPDGHEREVLAVRQVERERRLGAALEPRLAVRTELEGEVLRRDVHVTREDPPQPGARRDLLHPFVSDEQSLGARALVVREQLPVGRPIAQPQPPEVDRQGVRPPPPGGGPARALEQAQSTPSSAGTS